MKTAYEFRKKALDFARTEGYDSVLVKGLYENYEVYSPYCKSWKNNPPAIGLPQIIFANEIEVKWGNPDDPFSVLEACKKLPSVVFEYDCMCWFGNSFNLKLLADGTLLKFEYGYSKLGPQDRMCDVVESIVLTSIDLVSEIKKFIKANKEKLKDLPRDLSNWHILDGANETVRLGKMKFSGYNMFTEDMAESVEYYRTHRIPEEDGFIYSLYEFQKIFAEVKAVINKYCKDENIWRGVNEETC